MFACCDEGGDRGIGDEASCGVRAWGKLDRLLVTLYESANGDELEYPLLPSSAEERMGKKQGGRTRNKEDKRVRWRKVERLIVECCQEFRVAIFFVFCRFFVAAEIDETC